MGFFEIFAGALAGFYAVIPSLGVAIILLTLVVRVLLLPLSIKQSRSMREMQAIQPEIKKIQAKYKGNRQKMNEEVMALYKQHGVNPLGGCLPLLMQFPVLIALFYVVRTPLEYLGYMEPPGTARDAIVPPSEYVAERVSGIMEVLQQSRLVDDLIHHALNVNQFLGIRLDCSPSAALQGSDPLRLGESCGGGLLPALPYLLLVALMGVTTWYQQKQMQASRDVTNDPQARQMQTFAKIMPIMLVVFAYTFPAGVVLYWVTTNVWTIVQQQIIFRAAPELPSPPRAEAEGDGKPAGKGAPKLRRGKSSKEAAEAGDGHKSATEAGKKAQKRTGEAAKNSGKGGGRSSAKSGSRSSSKKKKKR